MELLTKIIMLIMGLIILVTFLPVYNAILGVTNTSSLGGVAFTLMIGAMIFIIVIAAIFGGFLQKGQTGGGDINGVY